MPSNPSKLTSKRIVDADCAFDLDFDVIRNRVAFTDRSWLQDAFVKAKRQADIVQGQRALRPDRQRHGDESNAVGFARCDQLHAVKTRQIDRKFALETNAQIAGIGAPEPGKVERHDVDFVKKVRQISAAKKSPASRSGR